VYEASSFVEHLEAAVTPHPNWLGARRTSGASTLVLQRRKPVDGCATHRCETRRQTARRCCAQGVQPLGVRQSTVVKLDRVPVAFITRPLGWLAGWRAVRCVLSARVPTWLHTSRWHWQAKGAHAQAGATSGVPCHPCRCQKGGLLAFGNRQKGGIAWGSGPPAWPPVDARTGANAFERRCGGGCSGQQDAALPWWGRQMVAPGVLPELAYCRYFGVPRHPPQQRAARGPAVVRSLSGELPPRMEAPHAAARTRRLKRPVPRRGRPPYPGPVGPAAIPHHGAAVLIVPPPTLARVHPYVLRLPRRQPWDGPSKHAPDGRRRPSRGAARANVRYEGGHLCPRRLAPAQGGSAHHFFTPHLAYAIATLQCTLVQDGRPARKRTGDFTVFYRLPIR
jgi:hypothetical protein